MSSKIKLLIGLLSGVALISACETQQSTQGLAIETPTAEILATSNNNEEIDTQSDGLSIELEQAQSGPDTLYTIFKPAPNGRKTRIDYSVYDEALRLMTYYAGPSLRKRAGRPDPMYGSRITVGHVSAFRLEGNKIFFSQFDQETKDSMTEFRKSIEEIGNKVDLTTLPRDEQLAYWINLHNVIVIEQIAQNYPVTEPYRIKVGPNKNYLHEAKIVTIKGVPLSLQDIRVNIVYRYWQDPRVIYGFFRGDLGSPNIQGSAYTRNNIKELLNRGGKEFVNSLRGVRGGAGQINISPIYEEARPFYFSNWPDDLKAHLLTFAQDDVKALLAKDLPYHVTRYETRVADLAGGQIRSQLSPIESSDKAYEQSRLPVGMVRMMREFNDKQLDLKLRFGPRGRVIIEDEESPDPDKSEEIQ